MPFHICHISPDRKIWRFFLHNMQFYEAYQSLLVALDQTFNGHPERLNAALGIMFELKLVAQQVMQFRLEDQPTPVYAAPPFMRTHEPQ
jgi:hypothetical protein